MPTVRVYLHLPGINQDFVAVDFLVDTGATDSCLHPDDARFRVGIDPAVLADSRRWLHVQSTLGVGGSSVCYIQPAVYVFHHDDGREQRIIHEIALIPPAPTNARLPSLLGIDILRHFKLSMDYVGQRLALE